MEQRLQEQSREELLALIAALRERQPDLDEWIEPWLATHHPHPMSRGAGATVTLDLCGSGSGRDRGSGNGGGGSVTGTSKDSSSGGSARATSSTGGGAKVRCNNTLYFDPFDVSCNF